VRTLLVLLVAAVVIAGCGEDESPRVNGTGYSYELPDGWEDVSDDAEFGAVGFNTDSVARGEPEEGFATNVNVIRETSLAEELDIDEYSRAGLRLLKHPEALGGEAREVFERIGAKDFSATEKVELDGEDARFTDYSSDQGGRALRLRVVSAIRAGTAYNITFTALRTHFEEEVDALQDLVGSWAWR
jgi:uncharacterized lipoprotein YehR (DUF1307 family)